MNPKPKKFNPALLVVDLQEDFCPPNGSLQVPSGRDITPIVNSLLRLPFPLKVASKDWHPRGDISFASNHPAPNNLPFISTAEMTHPDDPTRTHTIRLWPDHCIQGTPGAELVSELEVSLLDEVVEKGQDPRIETFSAFTDPFHLPPFAPDSTSISTTRLARLLHEKGITHVYVVGLSQEYCVKASAIDAVRFGYETFVIREGTRAVTPEGWDEVEKDMADAGVKAIGIEGEEVGWVKNL